MPPAAAVRASPSPTGTRTRATAASGATAFVARWWPWLLVGVAAVVSFSVMLYQGRGLGFFLDELIWIRERRNPSWDTYLRGHNGHLSMVPIAIYQVFFRVFGLRSYTPYRVFVLLLHLLCSALLFEYLRRRVEPVLAVALAVVVLFLGAAWQDLLWPFQMGFLLSVAGGLAALLLFDRDTARGDVGGGVAVGFSLAASSIGIAVAGALGLEQLLRRAWRRVVAVAIPVALYTAWWVHYGEHNSYVSGVWAFVQFVVDAGGAAVGALAGFGDVTGQWLLLGMLALLVVGFRRAEPERRPRLVALVAMPVVYWTLISVTRFQVSTPSGSRYLYAGAVFVALAIGESLQGVRVPRLAALAVVALAAYSVTWNLGQLNDGRQNLLPLNPKVELGAIDIGALGVSPSYAATRGPLPKEVAQYAAAFSAYGSPGDSAAQIRHASELDRLKADTFLVHAVVIKLGPPTAPRAPAPTVTAGPSGTPDGAGCLAFTTDAGPLDVELVPTTQTLRVAATTAPVDLSIRNFADDYFTQAPYATVPAGAARDLPVPRVSAGPWHVLVRSDAPALVCGA